MTLDLISRAEALRTARIDQLEQWKALQQKAPGMIATIGDKITRLDEFLRTARQLASIDDEKFDAGLTSLVESQEPVQPPLHISDRPAGVENEVAIPSQAKASIGNGATTPDTEPNGPADSMSGEASRPASGRSDAATSDDGRDSPERRAPNSEASKPVEPSGSAASSETSDPVTLTDQIAPKPTLKELVSTCFDEHPDWTARQIAEEIDRPVSSVQTTLAGVRRERAAQPEPAQEIVPESDHHIPAAAAIDEDNAPVDIPAVRRPKPSERFYVRDAVGRYVHQSLDPSPTDTGPLMTAKRVYAWFPNEQQFKNALVRWPELAGFRREVPEK